MLKMSELDLHNKRVLIRVDLNVPIEAGRVTNSQRIEAILPTLYLAKQANARIMLMSHLGRPTEGQVDPELSLQPVANSLSDLLGEPVTFVEDWLDKEIAVAPQQIVLFENVRFLVGEKNNDAKLAQKMAKHCDVFVMDAFATAHRKEASTYGVAIYAPVACAGPLLEKELLALSQIMANPTRPLLAIVGGAKVSTKLTVLESLLEKVNILIVGGGIANTFLAARGYCIGKSLYEPDLISTAQQLLEQAAARQIVLPLPVDVVVAKEFSKHASFTTKAITAVEEDDLILDIGPRTVQEFIHHIRNANTILWNGPVGVFEWEGASHGTAALAAAIAESSAYSVAGGGDTLAAIDKYHLAEKISYISTGGGAFLEYIEGKELPAVSALSACVDVND